MATRAGAPYSIVGGAQQIWVINFARREIFQHVSVPTPIALDVTHTRRARMPSPQHESSTKLCTHESANRNIDGEHGHQESKQTRNSALRLQRQLVEHGPYWGGPACYRRQNTEARRSPLERKKRRLHLHKGTPIGRLLVLHTQLR
jgi:hypothetical protein